MSHVLWMKPVFIEKIWGGTKLKEVYDYPLESEKTGECWAISAHPHGLCCVAGGPYDGWNLKDLWEQHRELFGDLVGDEFPLMVKLIDASQDLSVQVHPDDTYAFKHHGSLGKCECWYVLDANPETKMVMGHHAQSKAELIEAIEHDDYEHLLNQFSIQKGDFFYIAPGTIHAICAGSLIYEAQQSSDITYRVYDYHRLDDEGNERALHVQQSIDVTTIPYVAPSMTYQQEHDGHAMKTTYVSNTFFTVTKYEITGPYTLKNEHPFLMVSVIEGSGIIDQKGVRKGAHFIVCSDMKEVSIEGHLTLMVCHL